VNTGIGVFLTMRPAVMAIVGDAAPAAAGGRAMVMVQTALDPVKLTCRAGFDPATAPSTIYEGTRTTSARQRIGYIPHRPEMSLSMMPAETVRLT